VPGRCPDGNHYPFVRNIESNNSYFVEIGLAVAVIALALAAYGAWVAHKFSRILNSVNDPDNRVKLLAGFMSDAYEAYKFWNQRVQAGKNSGKKRTAGAFDEGLEGDLSGMLGPLWGIIGKDPKGGGLPEKLHRLQRLMEMFGGMGGLGGK